MNRLDFKDSPRLELWDLQQRDPKALQNYHSQPMSSRPDNYAYAVLGSMPDQRDRHRDLAKCLKLGPGPNGVVVYIYFWLYCDLTDYI